MDKYIDIAFTVIGLAFVFSGIIFAGYSYHMDTVFAFSMLGIGGAMLGVGITLFGLGLSMHGNYENSQKLDRIQKRLEDCLKKDK